LEDEYAMVVVGECVSGGMEESVLIDDIVWTDHPKICAPL